MITLHSLRQQALRISPEKFLSYHPGCLIQYFDDTDAKLRVKALSAAFLSPSVAAQKQLDHCAVCFSLQSFRGRRSRDTITAFQNLGVDVDLVSEPERGKLSTEELDARKDAYLHQCLLRFPLKPHWLIETRHGFHVIFRVQVRSDAQGIALGLETNRALICALHGDLTAAWLTQVFRIPRFYQFSGGHQPFRCKLLLDNAESIPPYDLLAVSCAIAEWEKNGTTTTASGASAAVRLNAASAEGNGTTIEPFPPGHGEG